MLVTITVMSLMQLRGGDVIDAMASITLQISVLSKLIFVRVVLKVINLKDCKSKELCCINCLNFNKGNKNSEVDTKHTVWDKNCHVYQQNLAKFKNNILGTQ